MWGGEILVSRSVKNGHTRPTSTESWGGCRMCLAEAPSTVCRQTISAPCLLCSLAHQSKQGVTPDYRIGPKPHPVCLLSFPCSSKRPWDVILISKQTGPETNPLVVPRARRWFRKNIWLPAKWLQSKQNSV